MFKKGKRLSPAPKPITVEQILSDLETFQLPKSEIDPIRTVSPNDPDFEKQCWKLFETFVDDVDQLKRLQASLLHTKKSLVERSKEINKMIHNLENEMATQKKAIDDIIPPNQGSS